MKPLRRKFFCSNRWDWTSRSMIHFFMSKSSLCPGSHTLKASRSYTQNPHLSQHSPRPQHTALPQIDPNLSGCMSLEQRFLSKYIHWLGTKQISIPSSALELQVRSLGCCAGKPTSTPLTVCLKRVQNWSYHFIPQNCSSVEKHGYSDWGGTRPLKNNKEKGKWKLSFQHKDIKTANLSAQFWEII